MSNCFIQIMELIEVGKRITCEHCPWKCKEQENGKGSCHEQASEEEITQETDYADHSNDSKQHC